MWARVDDAWWSHKKVAAVSLTARGLWITALSWSCHQRSEMVPEALLVMFTAGNDVANAGKGLANELVKAGLWDVCEGGWKFHDWDDYQQKSVSEKRADAGRKGGEAKARNHGGGKQAPSKPVAKPLAGTRPVPTRPEGSGVGESVETAVGGDERKAQKPFIEAAKQVLKAKREDAA